MGHSDYSRKRAAILLVVVIQWAIFLVLAYDARSGTWVMFNPDTMDTLTMARAWVHGHPLRLLPSEAPSTILSDLLSPLLFAPGYYLGFKSTSSFILWAYLECLVFALASTVALYSFFNRFLPQVVFPATFFCVIFPGIFDNMFSTNFGFFFAFFWAALASFHSFPRFIVFSVLASLLRPEGMLCYLFLVFIYASINGHHRLWRFVPGFIPLFVPHLIYKHLTGSFMPQGVVTQNIIHYQSLIQSLFIASATASDQVKGALLGLFPSTAKVGSEGSAWVGTLPPIVFVLALLGMRKLRRRESFIVLAYLTVLVVGASFSRFSGVHFNRHLHVLTPFFIGYALYSLRELRVFNAPVWGIGLVFISGMIGVQASGNLLFIRNGVGTLVREKEIVDHIKNTRPNLDILAAGPSIMYWADGQLKLHSHSVGANPTLGRHVKYWLRHLEVSEYIQATYPCSVLLVTSQEPFTIEDWLSGFQVEPPVPFSHGYATLRELQLLDLSSVADSPPYISPFDELDVGDPLSEYRCGYRYRDSLERPVGSPLMQGDGFWDGGRPSVIQERFRLEVPPGGGWLVARYKGSFSGKLLELFDHSPVELSIEQEEVTILANGHYAFADTVRFEEGFFNLLVPLDVEGDVSFQVEGLINSFHYWTYTNDAIGQGVESPGRDHSLPGSFSPGNPSPS